MYEYYSATKVVVAYVFSYPYRKLPRFPSHSPFSSCRIPRIIPPLLFRIFTEITDTARPYFLQQNKWVSFPSDLEGGLLKKNRLGCLHLTSHNFSTSNFNHTLQSENIGFSAFKLLVRESTCQIVIILLQRKHLLIQRMSTMLYLFHVLQCLVC